MNSHLQLIKNKVLTIFNTIHYFLNKSWATWSKLIGSVLVAQNTEQKLVVMPTINKPLYFEKVYTIIQ